MRILLIGLLLLFVTGCASSQNIYEGPELPRAELASISAIRTYPEFVGAATLIDYYKGSTWEVLAKPGHYVFKIEASYQASACVSITGGGAFCRKVAILDVPLNAEKNHTYLPSIKTDGVHVTAYFEDKGVGYPLECLPRYSAERRVGRGNDPRC